MVKVERYTGVHVRSNVDEKLLFWQGALGELETSFNGNSVRLFDNNKFFFSTKAAYKNFLSLCKRNYLGTSLGYFVEVNFIGLGARFLKFKNALLLKLGYSHYIKFAVSKSVLVVGYKRTLIIYGIDIQEVNAIAKTIRSFKKPDIYKGKGVQLEGEIINYKIGKQK